jgi:hypothetical protein
MSSARALRHPSVLAALLLSLLLAFFFRAPLARFGETYYSSADQSQVFSLTRVEPGYAPANRLLWDPWVQMQPWLAFNGAQLAQGRVPLWNPHNANGVPHLASHQSAVFSPFSLPFYVLSFRAALLVSAFAKLFALGFFTFLYLRAIGLRAFGSLAGALAFAFSGHNVLLLAYPHPGAVIALPEGLLFV